MRNGRDSSLGIALAERGLLPDGAIRWGIRRMLRDRLREQEAAAQGDFLRTLAGSPVAPVPEKANEQHYEVPADFFLKALGPRLKYSGCFWPSGVETLREAEEAMLKRTCEGALLEDGIEVLDLGCGWGSLSLWIAEHYPACRVLAVSNSRSQREFIEARCAERGLGTVQVVTADVNGFDPGRRFDRIISVEMFEHMRNYPALFERVASWLKEDGRLFVHVFCHRRFTYPFETEGADNWMGRYFFTGGVMPSVNLLPEIQDSFQLEKEWRINGYHYRRTAEAWVDNMDRNRDGILPVLAETYGADEAKRWFARWRIFFLACAELFGYRDGTEWLVGHYRFRKPN